MDSAFSIAIPDSSLAAIGQLSENSRLGFASRNPALHRGIEWSKSTLALGLPEWSGKTASDHVVTGNNGRNSWGGLMFFKMKHRPINSGPFNKNSKQPPEPDPVEEMLEAMKKKSEQIADGAQVVMDAITTILSGGGTLVDIGIMSPDLCTADPGLGCGPFAPGPNP